MLDKSRFRCLIKKNIKKVAKGKLSEVRPINRLATYGNDSRMKAGQWVFGARVLAQRIRLDGGKNRYYIFERPVSMFEYCSFISWLRSLVRKCGDVPQIENGQLIKYS